MKRFFGMMPSSEIELQKQYNTGNNLSVQIEVGKNGWTVLWADGGSTYADTVDSLENNLKAAVTEVKKHFPHATEIIGKKIIASMAIGEK